MKLEFRKLRADEIDIRAAICTEKGASLLLYKDARCDMNILDETVTPMGWMRQHSRDNANCTVSLWDPDKQMWISKEDVGTESNTEAEKGLASDSFKRACFNWGIGRELYTAPSIWVDAGTIRIEKNQKGKFEIKDKLYVSDIQYDSNSIVSLEIKTGKGTTVYFWTKNCGKRTCFEHPKQQPSDSAPDNQKPDSAPILMDINAEIARIQKKFGKNGFAQMRASLIDGGVIRDLPSDKMGYDDWVTLIRAIDQNFGDAA